MQPTTEKGCFNCKQTIPKCSKCGKRTSQSGYCNECLRKHRRSNNYLNLLSWVLDKRNGKCESCGAKIEFVCDFIIHRIGRLKTQATNNQKLADIKKWIEADKIPKDVVILCEKCSKRVQVMDKLEVLRYYPHAVVASQLSYDPYKRAKEQLKKKPILKKLEHKRISFMTALGRERYKRNYRF